jgi:hypothetical protein
VSYVESEVSTAVTMKNAVFWDVAPCRSSVNRRFGGTCHLHIQCSSLADFSTLKMEATRSSETSVQFTRSTRRHIPEDGILHLLSCFSFFHGYSPFSRQIC